MKNISKILLTLSLCSLLLGVTACGKEVSKIEDAEKEVVEIIDDEETEETVEEVEEEDDAEEAVEETKKSASDSKKENDKKDKDKDKKKETEKETEKESEKETKVAEKEEKENEKSDVKETSIAATEEATKEAEKAPTKDSSKETEKEAETHKHSFTTIVTKEATCKDDGEQKKSCSCGEEIVERIPATKKHQYGEAVVVKEPTCVEYGVREKVCAICNDKQTESFGSLSYKHEYEVTTAVNQYTHLVVCKNCGQSKEEMHNGEYENTDAGVSLFCSDCNNRVTLFDYQALINEEFACTNQARAAAGLPALNYNPALQPLVNTRAVEIQSDFSHAGFESRAGEIMSITGGYAGENIAFGYQSGGDVHNAWMNSDGHRANILFEGYTSMAIGVRMGANGSLYWVQIFG